MPRKTRKVTSSSHTIQDFPIGLEEAAREILGKSVEELINVESRRTDQFRPKTDNEIVDNIRILVEDKDMENYF